MSGARVAHTPELESWILRWSGGVVSIEPESLRTAVVQAAQTMLERLANGAAEGASADGFGADGANRKNSEKRC